MGNSGGNWLNAKRKKEAAGNMKNISTDQAPAAIGPYSKAIAAGGFLFASGQIPLDPARGGVGGEGSRAQGGTGE